MITALIFWQVTLSISVLTILKIFSIILVMMSIFKSITISINRLIIMLGFCFLIIAIFLYSPILIVQYTSHANYLSHPIATSTT